MIFDDIPNFIEQKRFKKALMACVEFVESENITMCEDTLLLWKIIDKYIPEDPEIKYELP